MALNHICLIKFSTELENGRKSVKELKVRLMVINWEIFGENRENWNKMRKTGETTVRLFRST